MAISEPKIYLNELYKCPFYWGKIDQIEAEAILKDQPNGSYLWKDPDQISQKGTFIEIAMKKNSKVIYDKILIGQMGHEMGGVNGKYYVLIIIDKKNLIGDGVTENMNLLKKTMTFFDSPLFSESWASLNYFRLSNCYAACTNIYKRESQNFNLLEITMTFFDKCKSRYVSELLASLNNPVLRNRPFSLLELARNKICNLGITYEEISKLEIPQVLQEYLQEIWVKNIELSPNDILYPDCQG